MYQRNKEPNNSFKGLMFYFHIYHQFIPMFFGCNASLNPSPSELNPRIVMRKSKPWKDHKMRSRSHEEAAIAEHQSPLRRGRLNTATRRAKCLQGLECYSQAPRRAIGRTGATTFGGFVCQCDLEVTSTSMLLTPSPRIPYLSWPV